MGAQRGPYGTSLLDNFNRASLGSGWSFPARASGELNLQTVGSTQFDSSDSLGNNASAYWNFQDYGPDCEVWFTVATDSALNRNWGCGCRYDITNFNGYFIENNGQNPTTAVDLQRRDAGAPTNLVAGASITFHAGDSFGVAAIGNTIEFWQYVNSTGVWSKIASATDSTYKGRGKLILYTDDQTFRGDDFGGGSLPIPIFVPQVFGPRPTLDSHRPWTLQAGKIITPAPSGVQTVTPATGANMVFTESATVVATKVLTGSDNILFTEAATVVATKIVSPATDNITFTETGTVVATKKVAPTGDNITFAETASVVATKVLNAASSIQFSESATVVATKVLGAASAITFAVTGSITKISAAAATKITNGFWPVILKLLGREGPLD